MNFRIKFQWSKEKQNRVKPIAGRTRRKSHKPNNRLRAENIHHRYNHENESISADNVITSPSCSNIPKSQDTLNASKQDQLQGRRESQKSHQQRRCSRKSEVNSSSSLKNIELKIHQFYLFNGMLSFILFFTFVV